MGLIYSAKLRPDQIEARGNLRLDHISMLYALDELIKEARENEKLFKKWMPHDMHWQIVVSWLEKQKMVLQGIHPYTEQPFTDEEVKLLQEFELDEQSSSSANGSKSRKGTTCVEF